jgi:hypothetical protein
MVPLALSSWIAGAVLFASPTGGATAACGRDAQAASVHNNAVAAKEFAQQRERSDKDRINDDFKYSPLKTCGRPCGRLHIGDYLKATHFNAGAKRIALQSVSYSRMCNEISASRKHSRK